MSIKIENWEKFDNFILSSLADDKQINFYSKDKGLKIAPSESDGIESKWSNATKDNNTLTFKDCERL